MNKSKKILVIYNYFTTNKGAYSTRFYEFSKIWISKGYEVEFITAPYFKSDIVSTKFFDIQNIEGIRLNIINLPDGGNKPLLRRLVNSFGFTFIASIISLFKNYDLLICSSGPFTIGIPNLLNLFFKRNGVKVFETRDLWPQTGIEYGLFKNRIVIKLSYYFERLQYRFSDYIVTLSKGQENFIRNNHPYCANKVHTISQISNTELFNIKLSDSIKEEYKNKYGKILTYVGGLGQIHNVFFWIQLCSELNKINNSKFSFIILGDGPDKNDLEHLTKKLSLQNVYFLGQLVKEKIPFWLNLSYANLFSTTNLPIQQTCAPNKLFDSFASGTPVIQTSTGWIKDYIKKTNCGITLDVNDVKYSAKLISKYLVDEYTRNLHANNSLNNASEFDKHVLANKYLKLIKK